MWECLIYVALFKSSSFVCVFFLFVGRFLAFDFLWINRRSEKSKFAEWKRFLTCSEYVRLLLFVFFLLWNIISVGTAVWQQHSWSIFFAVIILWFLSSVRLWQPASNIRITCYANLINVEPKLWRALRPIVCRLCARIWILMCMSIFGSLRIMELEGMSNWDDWWRVKSGRFAFYLIGSPFRMELFPSSRKECTQEIIQNPGIINRQ